MCCSGVHHWLVYNDFVAPCAMIAMEVRWTSACCVGGACVGPAHFHHHYCTGHPQNIKAQRAQPLSTSTDIGIMESRAHWNLNGEFMKNDKSPTVHAEMSSNRFRASTANRYYTVQNKGKILDFETDRWEGKRAQIRTLLGFAWNAMSRESRWRID